MKISDGTSPPILSTNPPPPPLEERVKPLEGRIKKLPGDRLRNLKAGGLTTPHQRWKFKEDEKFSDRRRTFRQRADKGSIAVSARKLAARMWHLAAESTAEWPESESSDRQRRKRGIGHMRMIWFPLYQCNRDDGTETKAWLHGSKHGPLFKGSTVRDPPAGCSKMSAKIAGISGHMKRCCKHQWIASVSVVSALQAELLWARTRIQQLELKCRSSKKKAELYLRKLSEEKASWMRKNHEKTCALIRELRDELHREKKNLRRTGVVNAKLRGDLADARLAAKKSGRDHQREKKTREALAEVCAELAKKIEEDHAEVEAVKKEAKSALEEVEEERKMLQIAEVWREERVHMKLRDAKLVLEEKYDQINNLAADLEAFLRSRDDVQDMIKVSLTEQADKNLPNINGRKGLHNVPTKSEDSQDDEYNEGDTEQYLNYSPASHTFEIQTVTPRFFGFIESHAEKRFNGRAEDQTSGNRGGGMEQNQDCSLESPNYEVSEVRPMLASAKKTEKKASPECKFRKSSPTKGNICKKKPLASAGQAKTNVKSRDAKGGAQWIGESE